MGEPRWAGRQRGAALTPVAVAVLSAALVEGLLLEDSPYGPLWATLLFPIGATVYGGAGLVALWRRPGNRLGSVLLAGAAAWLFAGLFNTDVPLLGALGGLLATIPLAIVVHLLHAFPRGRLTGRASAFTVVTAYANALALQAPQVIFRPGALQIASHPRLAGDALTARFVIGLAVTLVTAVLLLRRLGDYDAAQRRVVVPLLGYGIFAVVYVSLSGQVAGGWLGLSPLHRAVSQIVVALAVPVAFALVLLRGGFAYEGQLDGLLARLGSDGLARPVLVDALAAAIGDPSAQLVYGSASGSYTDASGAVAATPHAGGPRGLEPVTVGGREVGAITYDARLTVNGETVAAAAAIVAVAVDHQRITLELLASQASLRLAAIRVVEAAQEERRRIAQDLHDGLQADLVLLAIQANAIASSPDHVRAAHDLRVRLVAAAADLGALVNGVMPATLVERGLYAAVEDLADRLPIQTFVSAEPDSLAAIPASVESSAYFVVAEALSNAVKHSGADRLEVRFGRVEDVLHIEIADDGVGGARVSDGLGMSGIGDRVGVLGGRVAVSSPPGRGTRLLLELPCAS